MTSHQHLPPPQLSRVSTAVPVALFLKTLTAADLTQSWVDQKNRDLVALEMVLTNDGWEFVDKTPQRPHSLVKQLWVEVESSPRAPRQDGAPFAHSGNLPINTTAFPSLSQLPTPTILPTKKWHLVIGSHIWHFLLHPCALIKAETNH